VRNARIPALDAARALGVAAMVFGHTLDALLAPSVRSHPAVVAYWKARGFTAPVFIAVAGWAVTVAVQRSGATGWAIPLGRLRRVALLLAVGVALLWPGWGIDALLAGDRAVFAHLVSFGVLHTIALSIAAASLLFALVEPRRTRLLALGALALLAVALGMRAPGSPASLAGIALEQAIGGSSAFPLFPWMAYFMVGAGVGLLFREVGRSEGAWLAGAGALIVAATCWTGVGTMPSNDPILVLYRSGVFMLLVGLLTRVPADVAARAAPLGRASLAVYAIHVPIVYGWSTHPGLAARVGARLGLADALLVAFGVLVGSLAIRQVLVDGGAGVRRLADRVGSAVARSWRDDGASAT
jgi:uncharacterized membrane protein